MTEPLLESITERALVRVEGARGRRGRRSSTASACASRSRRSTSRSPRCASSRGRTRRTSCCSAPGDSDGLVDPLLGRELVHLIKSGATVQTPEGATIEFRAARRRSRSAASCRRRARSAREQSNSSLVFDEELILKVYRRVEAGINPELELLRFLTEQGFPHVPALAGWYAYSGRSLDATLGILQAFVPNGTRRLELRARRARERPGELPRARAAPRRGDRDAARLPRLASPSDPTFCPEEPSRSRSAS